MKIKKGTEVRVLFGNQCGRTGIIIDFKKGQYLIRMDCGSHFWDVESNLAEE